MAMIKTTPPETGQGIFSVVVNTVAEVQQNGGEIKLIFMDAFTRNQLGWYVGRMEDEELKMQFEIKVFESGSKRLVAYDDIIITASDAEDTDNGEPREAILNFYQ